MVIEILNHAERCYSNDDGKIIQDVIRNHFNNNESVTISFKNISGVTSSFVNTALIELLDDFDFNFIKKHLKFSNTTKQINDMIRDRFKFEVKKRNNLVLS